MSVDDWYCEQYGEMHNIQFVTKEVLLADLELFHSTWYFLMTMDISRYPNKIFIKILKQFWRQIQKSPFWLISVFFQEQNFKIEWLTTCRVRPGPSCNWAQMEAIWLYYNPIAVTVICSHLFNLRMSSQFSTKPSTEAFHKTLTTLRYGQITLWRRNTWANKYVGRDMTLWGGRKTEGRDFIVMLMLVIDMVITLSIVDVDDDDSLVEWTPTAQRGWWGSWRGPRRRRGGPCPRSSSRRSGPGSRPAPATASRRCSPWCRRPTAPRLWSMKWDFVIEGPRNRGQKSPYRDLG